VALKLTSSDRAHYSFDLRNRQKTERELAEMFEEARRLTVASGGELPPPYGLKANRDSLQLAFDYSARQQITRRRFSVDDVYADL
jgi:4,5-dihydroxyphthalate decarboxylase